VGWCPVRKAVTNFGSDPAVVDPMGVVLGSLRAALSVACQVILTGVVLTAKKARPVRPRFR